MDKSLVNQFDNAMQDIYIRAQNEAGYKASRFFEMLQEHRGLRTAQILLSNENVTEGYLALWKRERLDLTVEALVLTSPWNQLFTEDERKKAAARLNKYRFDITSLKSEADAQTIAELVYLLAWNPAKWTWDDLPDLIARLAAGETVERRWSCGSNKQINVGDRVFLIRLGKAPRGIMGSGTVTRSVYEDLHWNEQNEGAALFIDVQFDVLIDPDEEQELMLSRDVLNNDSKFSGMHWDIQGSGTRIKDNVVHELEKTWHKLQNINSVISDKPSDLLLNIGGFYTRREIYHLVGGGSQQSYLPSRDGKILCGCFSKQLNPLVPLEISVGDSPQTINSAKLLADSKSEIPVFIKEQVNRWIYTGQFRATGFSQDFGDLQGHRESAVAVLYLEEIQNYGIGQYYTDDGSTISEAPEGKQRTVIHHRKERSPQLIETKKRQAFQQHDDYICEACGLASSSLPAKIGVSCFEVHHLIPIANLEEDSVTKVNDLALLCANCHRMIHRAKPLMGLDEFRQLLQGSSP